MRILITGSRDWDDEQTIVGALWGTCEGVNYTDVVVVSGACPTGADFMAEQAAIRAGVTVERHPADWNNCDDTCNPAHRRVRSGRSYCPKAGFTRNKKMIDLGADVCLAFIKDGSSGASMTARLAEEAGIETTRYTR